ANALTIIEIIAPLQDDIKNYLLNAPTHISCMPFVDHEHWSQGFNDQLFVSGKAGAEWTHLQVPKASILELSPRREPKVKAEQDCYRWLLAQMQATPKSRPKSQSKFWEEAEQMFRPISHRQFVRAWGNAISESGAQNWSKAGRPKLNRRTS